MPARFLHIDSSTELDGLLLAVAVFPHDAGDVEESDPPDGSEALSAVATNHHEQCRLILDRFEKWAQAVFSL
ncbi:MAG: hypothetical protein AAB433_16970 [Nitrospirota bacterium]